VYPVTALQSVQLIGAVAYQTLAVVMHKRSIIGHCLELLVVTLQGSTDYKLRLLVHQSQAGCIIGKAGFKIKELREVILLLVTFILVHIGSLYLSLKL